MTSAQQSNEEKRLGAIRAAWNSFWNCDLSHYPRFITEDGTEQSLKETKIIGDIAAKLKDVKNKPGNDISDHIARGRETLDEVKGLTEYEDQKATRNLTVITFLSALAGVLFARYIDQYHLREFLSENLYDKFDIGLVITGYATFLIFVLLVGAGALIVFHATRIRFKYSPLTLATDCANRAPIKSYLFYRPIIRIPPDDWAEGFLDDSDTQVPGTDRKLSSDLGLEYFKNYVVESYLVAAKVADKIRYLDPAQTLLALAIRVLLVWFVIFALTFVFVQPTKSTTRNTQTTGVSKQIEAPSLRNNKAPATYLKKAPEKVEDNTERNDANPSGRMPPNAQETPKANN